MIKGWPKATWGGKELFQLVVFQSVLKGSLVESKADTMRSAAYRLIFSGLRSYYLLYIIQAQGWYPLQRDMLPRMKQQPTKKMPHRRVQTIMEIFPQLMFGLYQDSIPDKPRQPNTQLCINIKCLLLFIFYFGE